jgi:hypothetical protein
MTPTELLAIRRAHVERLSSKSGAAGEVRAIARMPEWQLRPKGEQLRWLLSALRETGIEIKGSSFDAIALSHPIDLHDEAAIKAALPDMIFVEVKTSSQARVKPGFAGFFFALTENELRAAEQLGDRHVVALFNKATGEMMITSVAAILARSRSTTWQVSVQL